MDPVMEWLAQKPTWALWCMGLGAFILLACLVFSILRAAWHSVDPPYQAVRRRPRQLRPWDVDPTLAAQDPPTETLVVLEPRRSLDPAWREAVLEDQPAPPARHRVEHLEEHTRAWKPADLRRAIAEREEDRG